MWQLSLRLTRGRDPPLAIRVTRMPIGRPHAKGGHHHGGAPTVAVGALWMRRRQYIVGNVRILDARTPPESIHPPGVNVGRVSVMWSFRRSFRPPCIPEVSCEERGMSKMWHEGSLYDALHS